MSREIVVGYEASQCADAALETAIERRRPADALSELAVSRGARLIVVGTTSERPLAGIVLGSVPYRLLHRARVPVLVVPLPAEHG